MENITTGEKISLKSHHIFGRNWEKADTVLNSRDISQIHSAIRWDGKRWLFNDYSRNGVWIDGTRIEPGRNTILKAGDVLHFSSSEGFSWKLSDLKPPATVLIPLRGNGPVIELDRFREFQNDALPGVSIYISYTGQWVYENDESLIFLKTGDIVNHSNGAWRFFSAEPVEPTITITNPGDTRFFFDVSRDEEHVVVKIQHYNNEFDLGERAHHYLLLTLARQRLKGAENGEDLKTQGWIKIEQVAQMLKLDFNHLNIHIFRARKQVNAVLPELRNLPQVIERRFGSLRFGYPDFQIQRGASIEGVLSQGKVA